MGPPRNPGGASRVASAGRGRAHARHVGVEQPAPLGLLPAAPRRPGAGAGGTAGGVPAPCRRPPQPQPGTQLTGQGRAPHRGPAPGGALRAPLFPGAGGLLPAPVREARRLCPGMSGGAGWDEGASLPATPWHGGKTGMDRAWWERRGAPRTAPAAELRRLAPGTCKGRWVPHGWTPSWGQWWGRRSPSRALPYATTRTRARSV